MNFLSITIKEIGELAGVSKTTVSKVINNKDENISQATREKILKIMKEKNYVPNKLAQSLVTKKTNTIGLLIPDIRNPFFTDVSRGVEDKANEEGYNIILCNTDEDAKKEYEGIRTLSERMIDGIIFAASSNTNWKEANYKDIKIPTVLIDKKISMNKETLKGIVKINNFEGAYIATKHLLDIGNKKTIYLSGPLQNEIAVDRLEGYKKALIECNLSYNPAYVFEGKYKIEWGQEFIKNLEKIDFDAIFCANDLIAIGVIRGLKERGLSIPNDISVVGFDDIQTSSLISPSLTTVKQPSYDIGYKASEILINCLRGDKKESFDELIFKPELVIRDSTKESE
ncbi:LacI family DNA-binding transcriptional regulator [Clostridioides difficile]|nr:LacI family DNA-binding transcriptional regulator [Clostridioides difficile]MDV9665286.1 LacI family DNA-binding transcriptional regulator [Clostridioides difficile]MDV9733568.1 LacI family DNA-binding transcriptional regulator [Clostridioides difficile]MDV9775733.1 LacI family DNA-binding transcriptional regulator [Clostridioides difficile]MDV9785950.1 LacI family DNA-binding transcriptional regulator [Clostridioides difficile]